MDDSVFFVLSLNQLQGVCGHASVDHRMCELTHNITDNGNYRYWMGDWIGVRQLPLLEGR